MGVGRYHNQNLSKNRALRRFYCRNRSLETLNTHKNSEKDLELNTASRSKIQDPLNFSRSRSEDQDPFMTKDPDLKILDFQDQRILPSLGLIIPNQ